MTRRKICCYAFIAAALFLFGCAGAGGTNFLHVQAGPGGLSSKKTEINDKWLGRVLNFGEVNVRPLGLGSSMEAQVIIMNESSRNISFEYRFLWYDASGFELSSISNWIPASLSGKEGRGFKSTAPDPSAASFKCMVRKIHPITDTGS